MNQKLFCEVIRPATSLASSDMTAVVSVCRFISQTRDMLKQLLSFVFLLIGGIIVASFFFFLTNLFRKFSHLFSFVQLLAIENNV